MTTEHTTYDQIPQDYDKTIVAGNVKSTMKSIDAKFRDLCYYMVPSDSLTILPDFNVRPKNAEYYSAVREIADSIKTHGFYQHKPFAVLVMKENDQEILAVYDGHTRYDALMLAINEGALVERVPVVAAPASTTLEDITVGLVTNNSGRQLDPMGLAIVCKRLVGYGLDNTTISKRLGFTPAYVGGLLSLIGAPKPIRDMVTDGKVSATLAVATLRDHGEKAIEVLENGLVSATESGKSKVTAKHVTTPRAPRAPKNSDTPENKAQVIPKKNDVLITGLSWIEDNGCMESSYAMLAAITGISIPELKRTKI